MKRKAVADFFNTNTYLDNSFNIALRKTIIKELLPANFSPEKLLDIGCGDGSLSLPFIKNSELVLIDVAENMLLQAKANLGQKYPKKRVSIIKGDVLSYNFDKKFQLILCIGVIAHIENPKKLLTRVHELLTDDGMAILQISDANHFRYKNHNNNKSGYGYKLNRFTRSDFTTLLSQHGLAMQLERGYSWSFRPLTILPQKLQYSILNFLRKLRVFSYLNSEWLFLVSKTTLHR